MSDDPSRKNNLFTKFFNQNEDSNEWELNRIMCNEQEFDLDEDLQEAKNNDFDEQTAIQEFGKYNTNTGVSNTSNFDANNILHPHPTAINNSGPEGMSNNNYLGSERMINNNSGPERIIVNNLGPERMSNNSLDPERIQSVADASHIVHFSDPHLAIQPSPQNVHVNSEPCLYLSTTHETFQKIHVLDGTLENRNDTFENGNGPNANRNENMHISGNEQPHHERAHSYVNEISDQPPSNIYTNELLYVESHLSDIHLYKSDSISPTLKTSSDIPHISNNSFLTDLGSAHDLAAHIDYRIRKERDLPLDHSFDRIHEQILENAHLKQSESAEQRSSRIKRNIAALKYELLEDKRGDKFVYRFRADEKIEECHLIEQLLLSFINNRMKKDEIREKLRQCGKTPQDFNNYIKKILLRRLELTEKEAFRIKNKKIDDYLDRSIVDHLIKSKTKNVFINESVSIDLSDNDRFLRQRSLMKLVKQFNVETQWETVDIVEKGMEIFLRGEMEEIRDKQTIK